MSFSNLFARAVAVVGGTALRYRRLTDGSPTPAWGATPAIPEAKPQGAIPTLKMPTAQGWAPGQLPTAAPGLKVNVFAEPLRRATSSTSVHVANASSLSGVVTFSPV